MADGTPRQIGRYKILGEIGRGGFGRVYRALDPTVGRPVAIKILMDASEDVVTRFHNEAMVAGNLRHKNIVTVYEYGDYGGKPFLSMEYLEGDTVQQLIVTHKPLSVLEKCTIMSQVADGLHHAHRNGVIHRDVKPANIMVLADGTAKIMDFGIARVIRDQEATRLTQEGSVIGTISYMSPEQFGGIAEVDALCDIFSFGIIWYEFITGRHPFEAPDARTMMYKMTFEDPPPIRDVVPNFPDSLQRVISRTLAKDRDLRYQSLKEVQFDLEPIRIELQQQRASGLLIQAQDLFEKGQLEPAQTVVLEVLTLDPSNGVARSLYDTLQRNVRQRTLQPRIEATLKAGEEQLEQRRFSEAVKSFESALRLDSENAYIQDRIQHARGLLEHSKEAASLLAEARRQLASQNLTSAYRCVTEALRHDPHLPEAAELLLEVQAVIAHRQREQLIDDALQKAEGLKLLYSYDEAIAALTALGPDANDPRVQRLVILIRAEKLDEERRNKQRKKMAAATDLLRERRLVEAVEFLTGLKKEFPENAELSNLLSYAQKELDAETRIKAVEKTSAEAKTLIESHSFDAALAALDTTLKQYPGESALIRLLGTAIAAKADWELEQAVQTVIGKCDDLRSRHRFAEAIELVEAALRDYSTEPRLTELLDRLEQEWAQQRRGQAVRKVSEQAQTFLSEKQPGQAVQVLQSMLVQYPDEPALSDLLERARDEVRAQEKVRALDSIRQQAGLFTKADDFDHALETVNKGLATWPAEPALVELRDHILQQQLTWKRKQAIKDVISRATRMQSAQSFAEAANLISAARRDYSDDPGLVQYAEQLNRAWEQHKRLEAIREIASEARVLLSRHRPEEAVELLNEGLLKYPGERELESAAAQAKQAVEARERMLAIQVVSSQAKELAAARDFDRAREVLEQSLKKYSGDPELVRQLDQVSAARRAWEHETAIKLAIERATQLASGNQFDEALAALVPALRDAPDQPSLIAAKSRIEGDFEQHNRRLAIAKAVADATALLEGSQLDEAMRFLRDAARRYPGVSEWPPLISRAERELDARKRAEEKARAVAAIERDATDLAVKRRFEAALQMVAKGLSKYPGEPTLTEFQKGLRFAREQHERAEAIQRAAANATEIIDQGRLDEALHVLEKLNRDYPGEQIFTTLLAQCNKRIADRKQRDEAAQRAEALMGEKCFAEAFELLEKALTGTPGDQRLTALREQARRQRDEARAREAEIRQAVEAIHVLAQRGQFAEALTKAQSALNRYGDEVSIARLRDEMRMRKGLAEANVLLDRSLPVEALRLLEDTASGFASLPEVAALTKRATEQKLALERSATIAAEVKRASEGLKAGDFDQALTVVEEGLQQWPDAASLIEVRAAILTAKSARERQLAVEDAIRQCESLRQDSGPDTALQFVQRLLVQFENEPALVQFKERIETELRDREWRQRRNRALQEVRNIAVEAQQVSSPSDIAEMLASLAHIVAQHPDDQEICAAAAESKQYLETIEEARRKLGNGDFAAVIEIANRHLNASPGHVLFSTLKREAEGRLRLSYLQELRRRIDSDPDLENRVRLLEEALARYPDEARTTDELRLTQNRLSLVKATLERAQAAEKAGDWELALEHWNRLTTIHEQQPNLKTEIERVQRMQENQRREAIRGWLQSIDDLLKAGDLSKAAETLRQAERELPGVAELREVAKRVEALRQKVARARELYSQAGRVTRSDWLKAEALMKEAVALQSGLAPPDELTRVIEEKRKEADITALLESAQQLRKSGDLRAALAALERALSKYPDESRLKSLGGSLNAELHRRHEALLSELKRIGNASQTESSLTQLEILLQRAAAIGAENDREPQISALAAQTVSAVRARIRQLRRTQLTSRLMARRKPIAAVLGGIAVLVAGWFGAQAVLKATREIPVKLGGDVPGVSVEAGGKHCVTPDCGFSLRPGKYTLTASKSGYKTVIRPVTIASSQSEVDVPLPLEPLPNIVQVNTNFANGRVYIDRGPPSALVDGAFSFSGLPVGPHTIRVTDGTAEFQARWHTALGEKPELDGPIVAKDVDVTVIGNVGANAAMVCNCGGQPVTVDGSPAGRVSGSPSQIAHLAEGARQIGIGGRSIVFDVKPNPTFSVLLALDRNVGTLVIETGTENAKVYLNNRMHGKTSGRDMLRIPVSVGKYSIRIEKDGFQPPPEQTVDVGKGEEKRLTFAMTPVLAVLEIDGAPPGAQVTVDGRIEGRTDATGSFRYQGPAATKCSIELSKDGYVPVRIETRLVGGTTARINGPQLHMLKVAPPKPRIDAAELEAQAWSRVRTSANPDELDTFARAHPGGAHADEAKNRSAQLRQDALQANAGREAAARAEAAWDSVDKTKKAAIADFLSRFGASSHGADARSLLARLEKQEQDARDRARLQEEQERTQAAVNDAALEREAISRTLANYEAAYNRLSLTELRSIWTDMPDDSAQKIGKEFRAAKAVMLQLRPAGPPTIEGNSAVVNCSRTVTLTPKDSPRPFSHTERIKVTLSRAGSGWTIHSMTPY